MRPLSAFSVLAASLMCASCATTPRTSHSPTIDHVTTMTLPDGHVAVLVRSYDEDVKLKQGGEQQRHVEYLWDYTAGIARERHLTPAGIVLSDVSLPAVTMHANEAEADRGRRSRGGCGLPQESRNVVARCLRGTQ